MGKKANFVFRVLAGGAAGGIAYKRLWAADQTKLVFPPLTTDTAILVYAPAASLVYTALADFVPIPGARQGVGVILSYAAFDRLFVKRQMAFNQTNFLLGYLPGLAGLGALFGPLLVRKLL